MNQASPTHVTTCIDVVLFLLLVINYSFNIVMDVREEKVFIGSKLDVNVLHFLPSSIGTMNIISNNVLNEGDAKC